METVRSAAFGMLWKVKGGMDLMNAVLSWERVD